MQVFDAIYPWGCCYHPFELWLQTEYIGQHMHIVIAGVHGNYCVISLAKVANWGPTYVQPVGLIQVNPVIYARAPKFQTIDFLCVDPVSESLNGRDHDYFPSFAMQNSSTGCPSQGRSTVREMWSWLTELTHNSVPFCHHWFRAISTIAWSRYSGVHTGYIIEVMLGGVPPTMGFMTPCHASHPVQPSGCGRLCWSPIC